MFLKLRHAFRSARNLEQDILLLSSLCFLAECTGGSSEEMLIIVTPSGRIQRISL